MQAFAGCPANQQKSEKCQGFPQKSVVIKFNRCVIILFFHINFKPQNEWTREKSWKSSFFKLGDDPVVNLKSYPMSDIGSISSNVFPSHLLTWLTDQSRG